MNNLLETREDERQNTINKYDEQAKEFLQETNTQFKAEYLKTAIYFEDDTEPRDVWKVTLTKGKREYSFKFGQSIAFSFFSY